MLDQAFQLLNEAGGVMAINNAMIEGRGDVHHFADGDLAVMHHWPLDDFIRADDRHLRMIDDRCGRNTAQSPQARQGDGGAAEFVAGRGAIACGAGDTGEFARAIPDI